MAALETGDRVVATARTPEQLDDLVAKHGDQARAVGLDVTDAAAAREAAQVAVEAFGGLDVVANNAGYANSVAIEEMTEDDFRAQVATNLFRRPRSQFRSRRSRCGSAIPLSGISASSASGSMPSNLATNWSVA